MEPSIEWRWPGPEPAPDYAMFPGVIGREIIRHLTGSEWKVLYVLAYQAFYEGRPTAGISISALQRYCGISRSTALQAIRGLCDRTLIEAIDLRSIGGRSTAVYRVLITQDRRYVARSSGSKIDPFTGSKIDPDRIENRSSRPPVSSLYRNKRERGDTDPEKYFRGQYAMCRQCGSLHCDCEER